MELINKPNNNALQKSQNALPSTPKTLSNYPTFSSFAAKFSPDNWEAGSRKPTKCVTCNAPSLVEINLAYGEGRSVAWLMAQLQTFQEKLNVPNKMSVYEVETCAQTIHDHFYHLKTTELMLFFARLLGGMYPVEWHGYVTPTKIVSALREHFLPWRGELLHKIELQEQKRHAQQEASKPTVSWEEYLAMKGEENRESPLERILKQK